MCYCMYNVAARDAIAKATYDRLFRWVVNQVNRLLAPDINYVHSVTEIGTIIHVM